MEIRSLQTVRYATCIVNVILEPLSAIGSEDKPQLQRSELSTKGHMPVAVIDHDSL